MKNPQVCVQIEDLRFGLPWVRWAVTFRLDPEICLELTDDRTGGEADARKKRHLAPFFRRPRSVSQRCTRTSGSTRPPGTGPGSYRMSGRRRKTARAGSSSNAGRPASCKTRPPKGSGSPCRPAGSASRVGGWSGSRTRPTASTWVCECRPIRTCATRPASARVEFLFKALAAEANLRPRNQDWRTDGTSFAATIGEPVRLAASDARPSHRAGNRANHPDRKALMHRPPFSAQL